ncbi:MAG: HEAT repeat domain-containing protein [Planctomycetes bacterium]|nr:HEAT repeat domain-containing protein [Planctomycetota bacterium]
MASGLELTFSILSKTQNEAAVAVLLNALDSTDRNVQAGALGAVLSHRSPTGHRELLRRWHALSKRWKKLASDSPGRLTSAIRDAVLSSDEQLHANGCDAAIVLREYDLIPALLTAAEDSSNPHADRSAETLLQLVSAMSAELAVPRDYRNRRNPHLVRARAAGAIEQSANRFDRHKRPEIVEAFLLVARRDNSAFKHILQHPHNKAYVTLVRLLSHSPRPGVMRLILDSLNDNRVPSVIYNILARRKDVSFVRHMLKRFASEIPINVRRNLKRIESFSWLCEDMNLLSALNGEEQRGAIQLAMASGMSRIQVFEVVEFIMQNGTVDGRREAANVLSDFRGDAANQTVIRALEDDDAAVRAVAVSQLRERGVRGAKTTLLGLVDSPDELVRDAARESLSEFTFDRLLASFGTLDDETRVETAKFVIRVDPLAVEGLREELQSPIRVRRIRAIQMADAMEVVAEIEPLMIALLSDQDHVIRASAAEALLRSPSAASRTALRDAILDRSDIVRDAAGQTLQAFAESELVSPSAPRPLPLDLSGSDLTSDSGEAIT